MFERFPSLTRFSHGWTISEKLDGTNAQILIQYTDRASWGDEEHDYAILGKSGNYFVYAGSRSKLIYPGKSTDNHGFARFVQDNLVDLVDALGEGRHFGEWVGKGINKRHYNLESKVFALFNTYRWTGADLPKNVTVVPTLSSGYDDNPNATAATIMADLKENGSRFAPGFMNPEGIVMYHSPSQTSFKKTFDYDEQGKWAEKL